MIDFKSVIGLILEDYLRDEFPFVVKKLVENDEKIELLIILDKAGEEYVENHKISSKIDLLKIMEDTLNSLAEEKGITKKISLKIGVFYGE